MPARRVSHVSPFPMDTGIDLISHGRAEEVDTGSLAGLSPSSLTSKAMLDQIFQVFNIESYLVGETTPSINDPAVLLPTQFTHSLLDLQDELNAAAEHDPRNARIFARAARLMSDQVALRELYVMYKNVLLQG